MLIFAPLDPSADAVPSSEKAVVESPATNGEVTQNKEDGTEQAPESKNEIILQCEEFLAPELLY